MFLKTLLLFSLVCLVSFPLVFAAEDKMSMLINQFKVKEVIELAALSKISQENKKKYLEEIEVLEQEILQMKQHRWTWQLTEHSEVIRAEMQKLVFKQIKYFFPILVSLGMLAGWVWATIDFEVDEHIFAMTSIGLGAVVFDEIIFFMRAIKLAIRLPDVLYEKLIAIKRVIEMLPAKGVLIVENNKV